MSRLAAFYLCSLFVMLAVSACAHRHDGRKRQITNFSTQIEEDDSKRFLFSMRSAQRGNRRNARQGAQAGNGGGNNGQPSRQRSDQSEQIKRRLVALLNEKLESNGYCRQGYFELDFSYLSGYAQLRGECNESATAEDRDNWQL